MSEVDPSLDDLVDDAESTTVDTSSVDRPIFDNDICIVRNDDGSFTCDTWLMGALSSHESDGRRRRSALEDFGRREYECFVDETGYEHDVMYVDFTSVTHHASDARLSDVMTSYLNSGFATLAADLESGAIETKFAAFLASR